MRLHRLLDKAHSNGTGHYVVARLPPGAASTQCCVVHPVIHRLSSLVLKEDPISRKRETLINDSGTRNKLAQSFSERIAHSGPLCLRPFAHERGMC